MTAADTASQLLANKPNMTVEELAKIADKLDPKSEGLFWMKVREINPTLCADW